LKDINYIKARKLAACYNSTIFKKGQVIIKIGDLVSQLYIVKEGKLKVEKKIELKDANLWPTGSHKWEVSI
jgi:hypothetical protein